MARAKKQIIKSKNKNSSGLSTLQGSKVVKKVTEKNVKKNIVKAKVKCPKCLKVVSSTKNKAGVCVKCMKNDAAVSSQSSFANTKKDLNKKETSKPTIGQKENKMKLRGKKRSYAALANGIIEEEEHNVKKPRNTNTNKNKPIVLSGSRNKKPTAKGSEWLDTIHSKKSRSNTPNQRSKSVKKENSQTSPRNKSSRSTPTSEKSKKKDLKESNPKSSYKKEVEKNKRNSVKKTTTTSKSPVKLTTNKQNKTKKSMSGSKVQISKEDNKTNKRKTVTKQANKNTKPVKKLPKNYNLEDKEETTVIAKELLSDATSVDTSSTVKGKLSDKDGVSPKARSNESTISDGADCASKQVTQVDEENLGQTSSLKSGFKNIYVTEIKGTLEKDTFSNNIVKGSIDSASTEFNEKGKEVDTPISALPPVKQIIPHTQTNKEEGLPFTTDTNNHINNSLVVSCSLVKEISNEIDIENEKIQSASLVEVQDNLNVDVKLLENSVPVKIHLISCKSEKTNENTMIVSDIAHEKQNASVSGTSDISCRKDFEFESTTNSLQEKNTLVGLKSENYEDNFELSLKETNSEKKGVKKDDHCQKICKISEEKSTKDFNNLNTSNESVRHFVSETIAKEVKGEDNHIIVQNKSEDDVKVLLDNNHEKLLKEEITNGEQESRDSTTHFHNSNKKLSKKECNDILEKNSELSSYVDCKKFRKVEECSDSQTTKMVACEISEHFKNQMGSSSSTADLKEPAVGNSELTPPAKHKKELDLYKENIELETLEDSNENSNQKLNFHSLDKKTSLSNSDEEDVQTSHSGGLCSSKRENVGRSVSLKDNSPKKEVIKIDSLNQNVSIDEDENNRNDLSLEKQEVKEERPHTTCGDTIEKVDSLSVIEYCLEETRDITEAGTKGAVGLKESQIDLESNQLCQNEEMPSVCLKEEMAVIREESIKTTDNLVTNGTGIITNPEPNKEIKKCEDEDFLLADIKDKSSVTADQSKEVNYNCDTADTEIKPNNFREPSDSSEERNNSESSEQSLFNSKVEIPVLIDHSNELINNRDAADTTEIGNDLELSQSSKECISSVLKEPSSSLTTFETSVNIQQNNINNCENILATKIQSENDQETNQSLEKSKEVLNNVAINNMNFREASSKMDIVAEDSCQIDNGDCESMICNSETQSSHRMSVDEDNIPMDLDNEDVADGSIGLNFQGTVENEVMEVS